MLSKGCLWGQAMLKGCIHCLEGSRWSTSCDDGGHVLHLLLGLAQNNSRSGLSVWAGTRSWSKTVKGGDGAVWPRPSCTLSSRPVTMSDLKRGSAVWHAATQLVAGVWKSDAAGLGGTRLSNRGEGLRRNKDAQRRDCKGETGQRRKGEMGGGRVQLNEQKPRPVQRDGSLVAERCG